MTSPESRYSFKSPYVALIEMVNRITGTKYTESLEGYHAAKKDLEERDKKVMRPTRTREELTQLFSKAMSEGDYGGAFDAANQLYAFERERFGLSIQVYRELEEKLIERFSTEDQFLIENGLAIQEQIRQAKRQGNVRRESELLIGVATMVAFSGKLGEKAKEEIDPLNVVVFIE